MADPPESRDPLPRRRLWLKRLALAGVLVLLAVAGLRLVWGQLMQARIDRAVADIHAKGEPILFEDLHFEPVPAHENGARYIEQALQAWPNVPGSAALRIDDTDWYIEGPDAGYTDPITDNPAYLAQCKASLDLLRRAAECELADWGVVVTRPVIDISSSHLSEMRRLATLLRDAAERAADMGRYDLYFEIATLQYTLARHLQSRPYSLLDSLVAISITAMISDTIHQRLPDIEPAALSDPAVRAQAQTLIASLTDESTMREGMIRGLVMERYAVFDYFECLLDGTPINLWYISAPDDLVYDTPVLKQAMRPMVVHAQASAIDQLTARIEGLRRGEPYAQMQDASAQAVQAVTDNPGLYPYMSEFYGDYGLVIRTSYRNAAKMRMAGVALAIRLYEADHGHRPETLSQLVPQVLNRIPADPFADDGRPLGYLPQGLTPVLTDTSILTDEQRAKLAGNIKPYALLYSIGSDLIVQRGGTLEMNPQGNLVPTEFTSPDEPGDIQFLLDAQPKPVFTEVELYGNLFLDDYPDDFDQDLDAE